MKKLFFFFAILLSIGCTRSLLYMDEPSENNVSLSTKVSLLSKQYAVSFSDVMAYVRFQQMIDSKKQLLGDIDVIYVKSEPALYIINYQDGWELVSADKRTIASLASSPTGYFSEENCNPAMKTWIDGLAYDVYHLRCHEECAIPTEELAENLAFWNSFCDPDGFVRDFMSINPHIDTLPPFPSGHYELADVTITAQAYDTGHLMQTHWHTHSPFNNCCPLTYYGSDERCVAGCVAIAGAQVLYYLHNLWGTPEYAPDDASCNGTSFNDIVIHSTSSTIWDEFSTDPAKAAPLIADIGKKLEMRYGANASGAYMPDLLGVFETYGITGEFGAYDADTLSFVIQNILDGKPVIMDAVDLTEYYLYAHTFVMDRCKGTRQKYTYHYVYVSDQPGFDPIPLMPEDRYQYEYVYSPSMITQVGMNWGNADDNDNALYTVTGAWLVGNINYHLYRLAFYNFDIL